MPSLQRELPEGISCCVVLSSFGFLLLILYTPSLQKLFGVTSPQLADWAYAILFTAIVFCSLEVGKYVASKRRRT
jgi:hypothetical protein